MTAAQETTACKVKDLGLIDYDKAYALQKQYVNELLQGAPQSLLLCEHPPVLTFGRLADERHMFISKNDLAKQGIGVHYIDRGGDITLHAPGQLVVYPILDLANSKKDLRFYLYQLEQVAIDLLADFDIVASRFPGRTGVWSERKKIVSIGIGVRKWVSFHGLAVNVDIDLRLFSMIKPCGLDVKMTSMSEVKGKIVSVGETKEIIIDRFSRNFKLDCLRS